MNRSIEDLAAEALALPAASRAFLAEKLLESLDREPDAELSPAWQEEVARRTREIAEGLVTLRNAEEVFARAYEAR